MFSGQLTIHTVEKKRLFYRDCIDNRDTNPIHSYLMENSRKFKNIVRFFAKFFFWNLRKLFRYKTESCSGVSKPSRIPVKSPVFLPL